MDLNVVDNGAGRYLAGPAGQSLLARAEGVTELVGACFSNGTRRLLLYAENLPPRFVDLSSGEAGAVLQKLQTYHIRTAIVIDLEQTPHSRYFADMVAEANRGRDFHFCAEPEAAERWLLAE
jgi:hypothetical protein